MQQAAQTKKKISVANSSEDLNVDADSKGLLFKPRLGLGSTDNENIALRRNHRELELLCRKQKMLGIEQEYVLKIIDLYSKSAQVNYRRLTKRVGKIRSHLTEDEIKELENDVRKKEFVDKYKKILRNQTMSEKDEACAAHESEFAKRNSNQAEGKEENILPTVEEAEENAVFDCGSVTSNTPNNKERKRYNQASQGPQESSNNKNVHDESRTRPITCPDFGSKSEVNDDFPDFSFGEIIPSLESLLDQIHNIKPQQFYDNQRKLKLYDIQLYSEELETRKETLFKNVDEIINRDKKKTKEEEEEEERKKQEEEESKKPQKRKTTFMRSVLRNFSMELMMKTMQYGWADMGKCRYLRKRGGDDDEEDGANTLAKNTMKIQIPHDTPDEDAPPPRPLTEPGFGPDGKMIRTADLLGLK